MDGSKAPSDDKKRFIRLLQGLKAAYTSPNFMPDEEAVKVWYCGKHHKYITEHTAVLTLTDHDCKDYKEGK